MTRTYKTLILKVLTLVTYVVHHAGSTQTVTCQQHGTAVLPFHFPFISGPEDLHVSLIKMESIEGDTKPLVICTLNKGAVDYQADQYRHRTKIRTDLSSGNLELILKHVQESDQGLYKCQAANTKDYGEKIIQLYIKISVKATEIMAAEGESVTFQPDFSGPCTEVVWKNGEDKLVELNQNEAHYYRLADRASASFHSGSLTIRELVESDSGHYSGNILTEGKYHETKFTLKVSPSRPKVHYFVTENDIIVYCESTSTGVTYEWRNSSGDILSTEAVYIVSPENLSINDLLICIVRNKVSESTSSLTIEDYLPEGKAKPFWYWFSKIIIIIIIFFGATAVILYLCCIIWNKNKITAHQTDKKNEELNPKSTPQETNATKEEHNSKSDLLDPSEKPKNNKPETSVSNRSGHQ